MKCPAIFRIESNRVWRTYLGGRTLDEISGEANPADSHFPEDWILSTTLAKNIGRETFTTEGLSSLSSTGNGTQFLSEWLDRCPVEMLGERHLARFGKSAGFLLKFLDSSIRLHMQCHPTVSFSRRFLNSEHGKSEGYLILGSRPEVDPYIYLGFQHLPEQKVFRKAILEQNEKALLECFEKIPVRPGDVFFVPGGFPHAIGEGIFMIEIMEPTDFAVRIEFERGGYVLPEQARFMGRDVDFALSMFEFRERSVEEIRREQFVLPQKLPLTGAGERFSLFDSRYTNCFRAELIKIHGVAEVEHDSFRVLVVTDGEGLVSAGNETLSLKRFDRVLIPHWIGKIRLESQSGMTLAVALPPETENR